MVIMLGLPFSYVVGRGSTGSSATGWLVSNLVGSLALVLVLWLASRTVLHDRVRTPAPLPVVLGVWIAAGAARQVTMAATGWVEPGVGDDDPLNLVLLAVAVAGWLGVSATVLALHDVLRRRADELTESEALLLAVSDGTAASVRARRVELIEAVEFVLRPELARLVTSLQQLQSGRSRAQLLALADQVDSQSRALVREVSQRVVAPTRVSPLADGSLSLRSPFDWRALLSIRVSVGLAIALRMMIAVPWALAGDGSSALPMLALLFALGAGVLAAGRWVCAALTPHLGRWTVAITYLTYLVAQWVGMKALPFSVTASEVPPVLVFAMLSAVGVLYGVAASLIEQGLHEARRLTAACERLRAARQEQARRSAVEVRTLERQISQVLHGPVQGRLATVAVALRLSAEQDEQTTRRAVHACQRLLHQAGEDISSIAGPMTPPSSSLGEQLAAVAAQWQGFLSFTFDLSRAPAWLQAEPELSEVVALTVAEAVTNASRHGRARRVCVRVEPPSPGDGGLLIIVADDGRAPSPTVLPGAGLGDVTRRGGTWRLAPSDLGGTELSVYFPLDESGLVVHVSARDLPGGPPPRRERGAAP